jgi:hypothetical protein
MSDPCTLAEGDRCEATGTVVIAAPYISRDWPMRVMKCRLIHDGVILLDLIGSASFRVLLSLGIIVGRSIPLLLEQRMAHTTVVPD